MEILKSFKTISIFDFYMPSKSPLEIGILETYNSHIPIIYSFSKICKTKNTNVTIFTTKESFSRLETYLRDKEKCDIILKKDNESPYSFLKRVEHICNQKIDLLFINTIKEKSIDLAFYLNFRPKCKMILTVHHANAWLKPRLIFNIKHIIRTIDTNLSSALTSKFILPKFDAINVIYPPIKDYILTRTDYSKEIFTLPTSIFEDTRMLTKDKKDDNILRVVIPGLIEERRKDYSFVLPAFEKLFKHFKENIMLYLLGEPVDRYGNSIYKAFRTLRENQYAVVLFEKFVPDKTFVEIITKCDVIHAPIRIKTRGNVYNEETYGVTVGSGVIYNAIQYAKPIIVPAEFNMLSELRSSTLTYANSKELEDIITELITNPEKLVKLKKEAYINAEKFSLKNLQDYFEKNVLHWAEES